MLDKDIVLLPQPRRVTLTEGSHALAGERFIWIAGGDPAARLRTGRLLRDILAAAGAAWTLTAARGGDETRLGAVLHVDPQQAIWPQGYRLTITPGQIRIVAHDDAGAFYVEHH
ncbi:MAG: glycoside hydrolase family 20 zincin-like fold domain-containing protein, partial [bacterium]|nr:glycoside hydrolase family 20 zincin-like fold domain-containing protein [bacterium]